MGHPGATSSAPLDPRATLRVRSERSLRCGKWDGAPGESCAISTGSPICAGLRALGDETRDFGCGMRARDAGCGCGIGMRMRDAVFRGYCRFCKSSERSDEERSRMTRGLPATPQSAMHTEYSRAFDARPAYRSSVMNPQSAHKPAKADQSRNPQPHPHHPRVPSNAQLQNLPRAEGISALRCRGASRRGDGSSIEPGAASSHNARSVIVHTIHGDESLSCQAPETRILRPSSHPGKDRASDGSSSTNFR